MQQSQNNRTTKLEAAPSDGGLSALIEAPAVPVLRLRDLPAILSPAKTFPTCVEFVTADAARVAELLGLCGFDLDPSSVAMLIESAHGRAGLDYQQIRYRYDGGPPQSITELKRFNVGGGSFEMRGSSFMLELHGAVVPNVVIARPHRREDSDATAVIINFDGIFTPEQAWERATELLNSAGHSTFRDKVLARPQILDVKEKSLLIELERHRAQVHLYMHGGNPQPGTEADDGGEGVVEQPSASAGWAPFQFRFQGLSPEETARLIDLFESPPLTALDESGLLSSARQMVEQDEILDPDFVWPFSLKLPEAQQVIYGREILLGGPEYKPFKAQLEPDWEDEEAGEAEFEEDCSAPYFQFYGLQSGWGDLSAVVMAGRIAERSFDGSTLYTLDGPDCGQARGEQSVLLEINLEDAESFNDPRHGPERRELIDRIGEVLRIPSLFESRVRAARGLMPHARFFETTLRS